MATPTLNPGKILGHFRLVEELGAGGMGVVYRAHDTTLKRDVALKVLNVQRLSDEKARQRFRSEALILSRLSHPNVEYVHEFRSEEGIDFLVLEYVPGTTLSELIKRGALPEQEVISLGIQLARGLAAAHAQRVIHRDLKPGNLRLTPDNVLKILDFGLAELMVLPEDDTLEASAAQSPMAGTPAYLSPEQIEGRDPDARSDIYSAGVVLYEMATGSKPFPVGRQTMVEMILHSIPPAPRAKNKDISPELEAIILKCLEKDPKQRYQSARDLLADLELVSFESHSSGRALALGHLRRKPQWHKPALIAVAVLLVLAAAGVLAWKLLQPAAVQQKIMAVLPMNTVGQDPATSALGLGLTETLAAKLVQASDTSAIQVVSPQDMRDQKVKTAEDAQRVFGTDYVLESSLQRSANTIRVNCYLVDSKTHRQAAAKTIESDTTDPFGLQDKVVSAALDMLPTKLKPEDRAKLAVVQNTQPAAYEAYIRGRGYMQEYQKPESVENAITEFNQAINIDPKYALAYAGLGDAYWVAYTRSYKTADAATSGTQNCQKALSLNPELVEAHICLANILNDTGKYDKAVQEFKRVLASNPQSDEALRGLALAYTKVGNLAAAESTYKQSIALRPNYWSGYHSLGLFYYGQARYHDALAMFQKEIEIAPDNYQSYTTLGGVYITLEDYPRAIEALQHSISLRPSDDSYSNLGYIYYLMHRFPEAIDAQEQALKIKQNNFETWGNLADALYWSPNRRPEAAANYKRAAELASSRVQLDPGNARIMVYLGGYLAMLGDRQEALKDAEKALKAAPSNGEVLFRAAVIYNQLGEQEQALSLLKKAADLGYSKRLIRDSPEFEAIARNPRFKTIAG